MSNVLKYHRILWTKNNDRSFTGEISGKLTDRSNISQRHNNTFQDQIT